MVICPQQTKAPQIYQGFLPISFMKISIELQLFSRHCTGALRYKEKIREEPCLKGLSVAMRGGERNREHGM